MSSAAPAVPTPTFEQRQQTGVRAMLADNLARPLRYTPENGDFVIVNGDEFFNRPLYGGSSPFRVDAGDRPEFTLFLPGRGGNLRLGASTATGHTWLHEAAHIVARYRAGSMIYEIRDPRLGPGTLHLTVLSPRSAEGLVVKIETKGFNQPIELLSAFGGIDGHRGNRDGDIGTDRLPVREFFRLKPEFCAGNVFTLTEDSFVVRARAGAVAGLLPAGTRLHLADASLWDDLQALLPPSESVPDRPIAVARSRLAPDTPSFVSLQNVSSFHAQPEVLEIYRKVAATDSAPQSAHSTEPWRPADLPDVLIREERERQAVAGRVTIHTPDPFINAAMPALNIAADAVWDGRQSGFVHGGVAWRVRLLGWRIGYAGDSLGWHDRTRTHFDGYAARQNTSPVPASLPPPEASALLSRNEDALHSNGDLTRSHYDMNLVGVDTFFRHLLWTGDLEYARRQWPVIERHLAWERRLFRREFGPDKLPLYEAYACIWASDDLAYNGGGGTHSSAYNLYHNRMAARVARLLGHDASLYEREADLILQGLNQQLWLPDRGWFGEWKDLLGGQLVHPNAAAWTFYHTVDSDVPTPRQAWQMTRFVESQLPRFDLHGPGVPQGNYTIATTSWMPYTWSLNNVVLAESVHTALGLWQSGRTTSAFPLFKGALLDSMYLGLCPGNVGMATWFDATRRESQRDFADGVGILARTLVEGLFGVEPDLLANEVTVRPGFPAEWNEASMQHPDFDLAFARKGDTERLTFSSRFARPVALRLQSSALRDGVVRVLVNGKTAAWRTLDETVGQPRVEILAPPASHHVVEIVWTGRSPAESPAVAEVNLGDAFAGGVGATVIELDDPQGTLRSPTFSGSTIRGTAVGTAGHRTLFARVSQGELTWWQPIPLLVRAAPPSAPQVFTTDWKIPAGQSVRFETVEMATLYNDRVSQIFRNEYLAPRSPFVSLATPKHGYGSWCHPTETFEIDDTGLRTAAAAGSDRIFLPNGVPLATPGDPAKSNVAFVSQWNRFPSEVTLPLTGRASKIYLLMAGSTTAMQSRIDNGEVIVTYTDGTTTRLPLENPSTWWPIDQDYFIDDVAFRRPGPLPLRIDLKTGLIRVLDEKTFPGRGRRVPGGSATVLDLSLDSTKELKSLTVRALVNEVVIGLLSASMQRI